MHPNLPFNMDRKQWKEILFTVEKDVIPVEVMEKVSIKLLDGSSVEVEVRKLINEGNSPEDVQDYLTTKVSLLDVDDIDFHINVDSVIQTVQPQTDELLRDL